MIPENTNIAFQVDDKDAGSAALRPDRYRIGSAYVGICAFMLMYSLKQQVSLAKLGSWFLLMMISVVLVSLVHRPEEEGSRD